MIVRGEKNMKKGFLVAAVLCCVFAFGSMTAISAAPTGTYLANIGSYTAVGTGPWNTVGFTLNSPQAETLQFEWKSEIVYEKYHVQLETIYTKTSGIREIVTDDMDIMLMGYYNGKLLQTPDIDLTKNVYVTVTTWRINSGKQNITPGAPVVKADVNTGLYNTNKLVTLSINKPGTIYYTLNGKIPTNTSNKYSKPIKITSTTILNYMAIGTQLDKSPLYSKLYIIDKIPPRVTAAKPTNNSKHFSLTSPIKIYYNEKISKGTNYSKIYIKNLSTGKIAKSTVTSISGNVLTLKMTKSRLSQNTYQVYIPTNAIKDTAGNKNAKYTLKFKTSRY
ncbi:hypothetical protein Metbo_1998 [Methanobacterium lacus]|uniref:Uncharacterized protein n=2 Tax=Methanobacterium lacus (strain AL-21) TaxID=877455 RepID=F0TBE8_METLA|nr:hypothetical protein Metbo_1998 [Methanobacterium lacus]